MLILARESPSLSRFPEQQLLPLGLECPGGLVGPHLLPSAPLPARLLLRAPRRRAKAGACRTGVGFSHSAPVPQVLRGPCSTFLSSIAGVSLSFRRSHILFWIFFPLTNRGISAALVMKPVLRGMFAPFLIATIKHWDSGYVDSQGRRSGVGSLRQWGSWLPQSERRER